MSSVLILLGGCICLALGYFLYSAWLEKEWGVDNSRPTPAHTLRDGVDFVPAKAPVLFGHHFSSIAGAGPINGPIQAAFFGWLPCLLWIIFGGIFFGAAHDYGALFASVRHKGATIGQIIAKNIGPRAKKLFLIFSYLTLLLVIAAFASIVAGTFNGFTAILLFQQNPRQRVDRHDLDPLHRDGNRLRLLRQPAGDVAAVGLCRGRPGARGLHRARACLPDLHRGLDLDVPDRRLHLHRLGHPGVDPAAAARLPELVPALRDDNRRHRGRDRLQPLA